jgi:hypothetical protein
MSNIIEFLTFSISSEVRLKAHLGKEFGIMGVSRTEVLEKGAFQLSAKATPRVAACVGSGVQ